jgi:hypothetical protein
MQIMVRTKEFNFLCLLWYIFPGGHALQFVSLRGDFCFGVREGEAKGNSQVYLYSTPPRSWFSWDRAGIRGYDQGGDDAERYFRVHR